MTAEQWATIKDGLEGQSVYVDWVDAARYDDGDDGDTFEPLAARTIGYVVVVGDDYIAVAHEMFIDEDAAKVDYRDVTTIPIGCIDVITPLYELGPAEDDEPAAVTFLHTAFEAPYAEDGVPCCCDLCDAARASVGGVEAWVSADDSR